MAEVREVEVLILKTVRMADAEEVLELQMALYLAEVQLKH
jgi:hypothetical protein